MLSLRWISIISAIFWAGAAAADPWSVHQTNIQVHEQKIEQHNEAIRAAVQRKGQARDPKVLKEIMDEMVSNHAKIKEQIEKRNEELRHMRYRHPEKGQEFDRKYYKTYRFKSLEEYEHELDLDGQLTRLKEKLNLHYGQKSRQEIEKEKLKDEFKESAEKPIKLSK